MTDLVTRLTEAAVAAIADQRSELERDPLSLRGITIEIAFGSQGGLADVLTYVERRKTAGALLGRHVMRATG